MEVLILLGAFQAVFFAVLLLSKRKKSVSDKVLTLLLLLFSIHLSFVYFSFRAGYIFYIENGHIPSGVLVIYYSLIYVYTQSLVSQENVFKTKWLLHLIPTVVIYLSIIPLAILPYSEKANLVTHLTHNSYVNLIFALTSLIVTAYLGAILILLRRHKISIRKMFSYEENISLNWLRILAILLVSLWIVIFSLISYSYNLEYNSLDFLPEDHMNLDMQGHIAFVVFISLLGFFGIRQQVIYSVPKQKKEDTKRFRNRYEKSGLTKEESAIILIELLHFMKEEQPYLNGKLLLKEVAEKMSISTNHLSQVINENLNKNFFDFVNGYRVELAKQKMRDPANKNYTLLFIAFESGFNSKSGFNSIFKKLEGITPSEFLKRIDFR